jgi:GTP cyclohydrolase I
MENWMEIFEEEQDKKREEDLKRRLDGLLDLLGKVYSDEKIEKVLEEILKVYNELKREMYEYDEKDYSSKKQQLAELKYKIMIKNHIKTKDAQSWESYKREEQILDEDEEER